MNNRNKSKTQDQSINTYSQALSKPVIDSSQPFSTTKIELTTKNDSFIYEFQPESPFYQENVIINENSIKKSIIPTPIIAFIMVCFPCCIGNPFSVEKRSEYRKAAKSIILFITIIQVF